MQSTQTRSAEAIERANQIEHARQLAASEEAGIPARRTLTVTNAGGERRASTNTSHDGVERRKGPNKPPLDGHMAFLAALRQSNADIVLEKVSSGDTYYGKLKHSDKFTLTMSVTAIQRNGDDRVDVPACDRVIFKHDISEFYTTTPRPGEGQRA